MSQSRLELKVGTFVLFCLALVAVLLIEFSRSSTLFRKTYDLNLVAHTAGGLRPSAGVLLSGVQVGTVSQIALSPSGTNVNITLRIYGEFVIKDDARFVIETANFLGDQYVGVYPGTNNGKPLLPGSIATVEEPFNIQEVARAAAGFIKHIDEAATNLNDAINDVRRQVLNEKTLTNFAAAIESLQQFTGNADRAVDNLNSLIATNAIPVATVVSNLLVFSDRLNGFAQSAQGILDTNRPQIAQTFSNLQTSTAMLTNLLGEAETGKGLAGALLRNEQLADNLANLASNLNVASANLRSNGLWRFLWKPKTPEPAGGKTK